MKKLLVLICLLLMAGMAYAGQTGGLSTIIGDLEWIRRDGTNTPTGNMDWGWYNLSNVGTLTASYESITGLATIEELDAVNIDISSDLDITGHCTAGSVSDGIATLIGGDISGLGDISATNLVLTGYGTTASLSDGTAIIEAGNISGVGDISATNTVLTGYGTAASLSDGTAIIEGGDISSVGDIGAANIALTGYATAASLSDGTAIIESGNLSGVGGLTATANLDIGAYDLRAATLTADGLTATRVVFTTTNGQLTDDADMTFAGDKLTISSVKAGTLECTPTADQTLANDAAVAPNATYVRVAGDSGPAVLDTDPAVNDGVADGAILIIQGTNDTNTVQIADACNTGLAGGQAMTLGQGDILQLVWDAGDSLWYEISRSSN